MTETERVEESTSGSGLEFLDEVHAALDRLLDRCRADEEEGVYFRMAVVEVATNLIDHACGGVPDCHVSLQLTGLDRSLWAEFEDNGRPRPGDRPVKLPEAEAEGGRGLAMAIQSVDEMHYCRDQKGVNRWTLIRRLRGHQPIE